MFFGIELPFIFLILSHTILHWVSGVQVLQNFLQFCCQLYSSFSFAANILYSIILAVVGLRSIYLPALLRAIALAHSDVHQGLQYYIRSINLLALLLCAIA